MKNVPPVWWSRRKSGDICPALHQTLARTVKQLLMRQSIRYLTTTDGVQLAWAVMGSGPALIKAANWLTHLQYDLESPVWQHWLQFFSRYFRFIRYDERGCGLTQWETPDVSMPRWIDDRGRRYGV
jgi:pimeloyl-ACP methyl ester carboxylesterase